MYDGAHASLLSAGHDDRQRGRTRAVVQGWCHQGHLAIGGDADQLAARVDGEGLGQQHVEVGRLTQPAQQGVAGEAHQAAPGRPLRHDRRCMAMVNWRAAAVLLSPPSITNRTMASRPFGVRGAFLWVFIWSLRGTLKLRNLSFLGSDQMDNLLKDHS